jgi:hypothetical protein
MRTLRSAAVTLLVLCLLLSVPLTALAAGPPDDHPGEPGLAAATAAADRDVPDALKPSLPIAEGFAADAGKPDVVPPVGGRPDWAGRPEWAGPPAWVPLPDVDALTENPVGETGVARARLQIERNIEHAETRVQQGTMKHVPPGLIRALEALMEWLGIMPQAVPNQGQ